MAFHFSLETVLRLRRSLEDNERMRLQTMLANRAQLDSAIRETGATCKAIGNNLKASLHLEALSGGELHFALRRLSACDLQSARLNASRAALTQQIECQQAALLRRRLDRKVLEQLRQAQLVRHEVEAQRRAQSQIEELFLLGQGKRSN